MKFKLIVFVLFAFISPNFLFADGRDFGSFPLEFPLSAGVENSFNLEVLGPVGYSGPDQSLSQLLAAIQCAYCSSCSDTDCVEVLDLTPYYVGSPPLRLWFTSQLILEMALANASSGDVIVLDGSDPFFSSVGFLEVNTSTSPLILNEGVTIIGINDPEITLVNGTLLFKMTGDNSRISGLKLTTSQSIDTAGIQVKNLYDERAVIDNNEITGFSKGIAIRVSNAFVHHNYIHNNIGHGGYGIMLGYGSYGKIVSNHFVHNRHDISAGGNVKIVVSGIDKYDRFDARCNISVDDASSHNYDMHGIFDVCYEGDIDHVHQNVIDRGTDERRAYCKEFIRAYHSESIPETMLCIIYPADSENIVKDDVLNCYLGKLKPATVNNYYHYVEMGGPINIQYNAFLRESFNKRNLTAPYDTPAIKIRGIPHDEGGANEYGLVVENNLFGYVNSSNIPVESSSCDENYPHARCIAKSFTTESIVFGNIAAYVIPSLGPKVADVVPSIDAYNPPPYPFTSLATIIDNDTDLFLALQENVEDVAIVARNFIFSEEDNFLSRIERSGTYPFDDDVDNDGIINACDNCMFYANPSQEDTDGDGIGDDCE